MALLRSFFQSPPLAPRWLSSPSTHELPLYQPAPTVPPPPVTSNVSVSTRRLEQRRYVPDTLVALERRERYLQDHLQALLDAQAEGLTAGLSGETADNESEGSSTPTLRSTRDGSVSPARRPAHTRRGQKMGLRSTRRAIWRTIRELADIKAQEDTFLESSNADDAEVLAQIEGWEKKHEGLTKVIGEIEGGGNSAAVRGLKDEAAHLVVEMDEMESRLAQMKNRYRKLTDEIAELENNVHAKLSSYKESLSLLDEQVQRFLAGPPVRHGIASAKDSTSFLSLPASRRTLAMAKEHWQLERAEAERRCAAAEAEREALTEGAVVWRDVVTEVTDFEKLLQEQMQDTAPVSQPHSKSSRGGNFDVSHLIEHMDYTIQQIEDKLQLAEAKGWKLLVCCIGAELEAFRQGRDILEATLRTEDPAPYQSQMLSSRQKTQQLPDRGGDDPYENSDGEPDPELLISHQDTDTE